MGFTKIKVSPHFPHIYLIKANKNKQKKTKSFFLHSYILNKQCIKSYIAGT